MTAAAAAAVGEVGAGWASLYYTHRS